MKKAYIFIIVLALTFVQIARAEENARRQLAEELLSLMDIQRNIEQTFEAVKEMQMPQLKSISPPDVDTDRAQARQARHEQMMNLIAKEMSWDKLKDDYISIYADTFTEEELKGLIEFYKGPLGRKLIEKTPELTKRSMQLSQKKMADIMPKIEEQIKPRRNEVAAIGSLRSISTACESFRAEQSPLRYPANLAALSSATPPYIDATLGSGTKEGYTFTYTLVDANRYTCTAAPVTVGVTGNRSFRVDQSAVIIDVATGNPFEFE